MHIILILSFKSYPIFEHLTSFMEQLLMYFGRHKRMETNMVMGHFATKSFRPWDVSGPRLFYCTITFKNCQGITMAETLILILAEHNVPINFADHFCKLVNNKLVFPDSAFLCVRAARAPCSLKEVIARVVINFFSRNLSSLVLSWGGSYLYITEELQLGLLRVWITQSEISIENKNRNNLSLIFFKFWQILL